MNDHGHCRVGQRGLRVRQLLVKLADRPVGVVPRPFALLSREAFVQARRDEEDGVHVCQVGLGPVEPIGVGCIGARVSGDQVHGTFEVYKVCNE